MAEEEKKNNNYELTDPFEFIASKKIKKKLKEAKEFYYDKSEKKYEKKIESGFDYLRKIDKSPCSYADWLECKSPPNLKEIKRMMDEYLNIQNEIAEKMQKSKGTDIKVKGGGNNDTEEEINEMEKQKVKKFISKIDDLIKIAKKLIVQVKKDEDNLDRDRARATAALSYIIRLFALQLKGDLNNIQKYVKKKHKRSLGNVMQKMSTYVSDTKD